MLVLHKPIIKWINAFFSWTELLNFINILIICDELLKQHSNVLGDHYIELLHRLACNFLIDLNYSVDMVTPYSDFIEDKLKKQLEKAKNMR